MIASEPRRRALDDLSVALCALGAAAWIIFAPATLSDPDTFWHVAAGRWILEHGRAPTSDIFSFTVPGKAWIAHEWLSEAVMAGVWRVAGWAGLLILFAAAASISLWLIVDHASRYIQGPALLAFGGLTLACAGPGLLARPHLLAMPLLVGWVLILLRARAAERAPPLLTALLMTLWANMHGGYILGLVLAAGFAAEAWLGSANRLAVARTWGAFGLAAGLACLFTPFGLAGVIHPFTISSMAILPNINEWRPVDFSKVSSLEIVLIAVLFAAFSRGARLPKVRLLMLLGLLHLALRHARHQFVLGAVGPLLLAPAFQGEPIPSARRRRGGLGLIAGGATILAAVTVLAPRTDTDAPQAPRSALQSVSEELRRRPVLNDYDFGGYLIFQGVRPFIDGRADMYGDAFVSRYIDLEQGDRAAIAAAIDRYKIEWTIFRPGRGAINAMDAMPGWRRLYADRWAVVHVRTAQPEFNIGRRGPSS